MPLKLQPPREGKTPNWSVRGTYLGIHVNRSTGTGVKSVARQALLQIKGQIERGQLARPGELTFADAALSYMRATGVGRFVGRVVDHFGTAPAARIDQAALDRAAVLLYPDAGPDTRNRQVYTPTIAILRHAGLSPRIRRPRSQGRQMLDWLWPEQARAVIAAAYRRDAEVGCLLVLLLFTGLRRSEAVQLDAGRLRLDDQSAYVATTKTGTPRPVYLHKRACRALHAHLNGRQLGPVFRWSTYGSLNRAIRQAFDDAGLPRPAQPFHIWRHTWATWMRRYGAADRATLVATGAWRSDKAAGTYDHIVPSEAARLVNRFPTRGKSVV